MYFIQSGWSQESMDRTIDVLKGAWYKMASEQRVLRDYVRPIVADSWMRCLQSGVQCDQKKAPIQWKEQTMHKGFLDNKQLIEIANPVILQLNQWISGTGFLVALANADGILLNILGEEDVIEAARKNNFIPGADWSERAAGTNGIGTSLVLDQPVQISSYEHFCQCCQIWTCSGAPIHDPITGKVLGILDISGFKEHVHAHNLGLVVAAAKIIEQKLREWQFQVNQRMYNIILDISSDGMIVVDEKGRLVSVNPSAREMLGNLFSRHNYEFHELTAIPELYEKWEQAKNGVKVVEEEIKISRGIFLSFFRITCIPVEYGNIHAGTLILLRKNVEKQSVLPLKKSNEDLSVFSSIITTSEKMKNVVHIARIAAGNDAHVLLLGESGTGKEVVARAIHEEGTRRLQPFVPVNCGAISKELLASELFGYAEGAFTGALKKGKKGKFELAQGGTIFLDEIGEMPLDMQVSLLRVLEEGVVYPVGGEEPVPISCRIIAATHRDLFRQVQEGRFREDLFYRLNVLTIDIPPLRERGNDILLLIEHFLKKFDRSLFDIEQDVLDFLLRYHWPGNVRQLKNTVERLAYLSEGKKMTKSLLPPDLFQSLNESLTVQQGKDKEDSCLIRRALESTGYNCTEAARKLGISRSTLYRKMKKYQLI